VPAVPEDALLSDDGRAFVFVRLDHGYFVRRPVTAGRSDGGWVELLDGPPAGTVVATVGSFVLKSDVLRSKMGAGCAD
jgi:cobalt-zinc-cadmium efflux system membrane fusion protein